jgi:hypothetical protein
MKDETFQVHTGTGNCKYTAQAPSGNILSIEFQKEDCDNADYYYVWMFTVHKRAQAETSFRKSTGRDGLYALLWARDKIKEFESYLKTETKKRTFICIRWDDRRRRDVYEYGLKKLGYKMGIMFCKKCLYKLV